MSYKFLETIATFVQFKFILTLEKVPIDISSIVYNTKAPQSSLHESRKKMPEKKSPKSKYGKKKKSSYRKKRVLYRLNTLQFFFLNFKM